MQNGMKVPDSIQYRIIANIGTFKKYIEKILRKPKPVQIYELIV